MDLVVIIKPHYFFVVFKVVLKIDSNVVLLRMLLATTLSSLLLFLFRLFVCFLFAGRFVFVPLLLIELSVDCISLVLNDDDLQFGLILCYLVRKSLRSNEKQFEYESSFGIVTKSLIFLFPFCKADHEEIHLFFHPSYQLSTQIICRFQATS